MHVKRHHTQFTGVTSSSPVKTGKVTCFHAASTSRKLQAIARYKARMLRVTSPADYRLTYLEFEGEFTRGVIADCLQLQVFWCAIAAIFACDCAGVITCDSSVFACKLHVVFACKLHVVFACKSRQYCMLVAGKFAWVPHVKLPVNYPADSGKFTCGCKHLACILRELLAA